MTVAHHAKKCPVLLTAELEEEKKNGVAVRIQDGGDKEKTICTEAEELSHIIFFNMIGHIGCLFRMPFFSLLFFRIPSYRRHS